MLAQKLTEVVNTLTVLTEDAQKADKGNKSAARRVRVALQQVKKDLQEVRQLSLGDGEKDTEEK
jgi:hypothetical protein